jgi:hypothetical protein
MSKRYRQSEVDVELNPYNSGFMVDRVAYYFRGITCGICKGPLDQPHKRGLSSLIKDQFHPDKCTDEFKGLCTEIFTPFLV